MSRDVKSVLLILAGDAETCLICETIIQYVEALLQDNATITEIETILKKVCNFLPDTEKTQVTRFHCFHFS